MSLRTIRDTRLWIEERGAGSETVLFSHGLLWSAEMFAAQVSALAPRFRCLSYDHRGQGRSADGHGRCIDLGTLTGDAIAIIETLATGPVHFVGLSMGGFIGMRIAARRPDLVRSLVLLETSADPEPDENVPRYRTLNLIARTFGMKAVSRRVMPIMFGRTFLNDPARGEERELWRAKLEANRRSIWRAVNGVIERETVHPELRRIRAPTLVGVGEEDVATVPAKSERIVEAIEGAELVRFPRAGHSSSVEQPQLVADTIGGFVARW